MDVSIVCPFTFEASIISEGHPRLKYCQPNTGFVYAFIDLMFCVCRHFFLYKSNGFKKWNKNRQKITRKVDSARNRTAFNDSNKDLKGFLKRQFVLIHVSLGTGKYNKLSWYTILHVGLVAFTNFLFLLYFKLVALSWFVLLYARMYILANNQPVLSFCSEATWVHV